MSSALRIPQHHDDSAVDTSHDLSPTSPVDVGRMDKMFARRSSAGELQDKGILKGAPNDALAGKRADLEKSMRSDRLDKDLSKRPTADELVQKGILTREDTA